MNRYALLVAVAMSCLICSSGRADEAVMVEGASAPAAESETWSSHRPESWLRLAQGRLSNILCELGPAGAWVETFVDRYLTALESSPELQAALHPPRTPEWCDGLSTGPPPNNPSRFLVSVSFTF